MPGVRAGPQPRADTMSAAPVSMPILNGGQRERVRRWAGSPAFASREFGWVVGHPMSQAWSIDMSAPATASGSPRPGLRAPRARRARRCPPRPGAVVDVIQDGPSMAARIAWLSARLMIRPALSVGSYLPSAPWPWGGVEFAARALSPAPGTVRADIRLAHCTAQLVRAAGVLPADGTRRVVLYLHGGAFLTCGAYSHGRLVSMLSRFADSPVLVPNYRKVPKHSISDAIDDCYDGYRWLRRKGYRPDQIVLAGDSAGGYLGLALAATPARVR